MSCQQSQRWMIKREMQAKEKTLNQELLKFIKISEETSKVVWVPKYLRGFFKATRITLPSAGL